MSQIRSRLTVFCEVLMLIFAFDSYASDENVLASPIVKNAIYHIEQYYVERIEQAKLQKDCMTAVQENKSDQPPIEACLSGMVAGLDPFSSYYAPGHYKTMKEKAKQKEESDNVIIGSLIDRETGYIAVSQFMFGAREKLMLKLADIASKTDALTGIIVDLRNCSGGILQDVVDVAGIFLPDKTVIGKLETQKKWSFQKNQLITQARRIKDTKLAKAVMSAPLVILVDQNTSRGAEFFAAALKEGGRAKVIGCTTAKRGDVQTLIPLEDKSYIALTSDYLATASGRLIHNDGVNIDIEIKDNSLCKVSESKVDDPAVKKGFTELKLLVNKQEKR